MHVTPGTLRVLELVARRKGWPVERLVAVLLKDGLVGQARLLGTTWPALCAEARESFPGCTAAGDQAGGGDPREERRDE